MQSEHTQKDDIINDATLVVATGCASIAGVKPVNEDAVAVHTPTDRHAMSSKGTAVLIADGVSSAEAGREASDYAVKHFIEEYFRTPDTWSAKQAGQKTLTTINLNLFKQSHEFTRQEKGYLCTFSGLVLKSRTAHFFHAGDSRIYRCRDGVITQLTRDHSINIGGGKNILARAVGMDNILQVDYGKSVLEEGDVFLLTTDGVHDFIDEEKLTKLLSDERKPQQQCERIIAEAKMANSDDNISCAIAKVDKLPAESRDDFNTKLTRLPFPPDLEPGMKLDGYRIDQALFASSRSQVYLVTDLETDEQMVMKTPSLNFQDDVHYIDRFIQEEWIGKRINSEYVVKVITQNRPRTFLYYLMEYVPGISLDKWMIDHPLPSPKKAITLVKQIAAALAAFHNTETIHQDLKPANIIVDDAMKIKVIDFGSVFVAGIAEIFIPIEHLGALGTATYSDPYYLQGRNTGIQGDIYALATITYELFTGELPYGERIEQYVNSHDFDKLRYISATDHNPIIPLWFDRALEKGVSLDIPKRYRSLQDYVDDITRPNPEFLKDDPAIDNSKGLLFWQMMSAFWVAMLILVVILFSTTG
ncbi:bifunctional protein-serine/threonine kinase/phosphatase [Alteromonas mediterranea]|uniref:Serine/threonine protein kinase n=1 Tax=Alteromonas mediterranea (strain DSM 17117 / CIP 110805 / LMG 28347 / Deep ecotype) TaxID=1774373 RepID=F2GAP3_ALTMD|nr:bifunctional protein-serine/threonine kinase/phosphatase [Alteromonas mediterranea]AEB00008.1 serine/threonine protein kinase [Alteromonas mediterranea DE]